MDIRFEDHGSVVLVRPVSEVGEEWIAENVDPEALRFGGAVACERRYVGDIYEGAQGDGIKVEVVR